MQKETASIKKMSVFALTWPIFIETLLRTMLGNVDTFMLSTYSDDAVGAVGVVSQISYILIMLYNVVSSGTLVLISSIWRKKEKGSFSGGCHFNCRQFDIWFVCRIGCISVQKPDINIS